MDCPSCKQGLVPFNFAGVRLEGCSACAGIWFDRDELQRAKAAAPDAWAKLEAYVTPQGTTAAESAAATSGRQCPACRVGMHPYRFLGDSAIVLDECAKCGGHWVDDGELVKMQKFLAHRQQAPEVVPAEAMAVVMLLDAEAAMSQERAGAISTFCRALMARIR